MASVLRTGATVKWTKCITQRENNIKEKRMSQLDSQTHLDMWIYTKDLATRESEVLDGVLDVKLVHDTQSITICTWS